MAMYILHITGRKGHDSNSPSEHCRNGELGVPTRLGKFEFTNLLPTHIIPV